MLEQHVKPVLAPYVKLAWPITLQKLRQRLSCLLESGFR